MDGLIMPIEDFAFIRQNLPGGEISKDLASFFAIFADPTRINIISALSISDMCVGDLALLLNLNQSTISHQLKLLKNAGIVNFMRDGKVITYFLINPYIDELMMLGVDHLEFKDRKLSFAS